jgi:hypothetical protein
MRQGEKARAHGRGRQIQRGGQRRSCWDWRLPGQVVGTYPLVKMQKLWKITIFHG